MSDPRLDLLLALADDELVIGHRHAHWTGVAPHLEEDLAFSSIAQDEIGHAVMWYRIATELGAGGPVTAGAGGAGGSASDADGARGSGSDGSGSDGDEAMDRLGLGRPADDYRHAVLLERPNGDWAYSLARHYLYDTADDVRLCALADSSWRRLADATGALLREERYHLMHARAWLDRLAGGPVEARTRLARGLSAALADALGLFEPVPGEGELVAAGVLPVAHTELLQRWLDVVAADLERVGLERVLEEGTSPADGEFVPTSSGEMTTEGTLVHPHVVYRDGSWVPVGAFSGRGGRHGRHSDDWPPLWEEMTATYRRHAGARW